MRDRGALSSAAGPMTNTGQRAAFARSMFQALNCRLRNGPSVLLFDDPVAQVDDIKVLSFLDRT
jgi:exonuclease SbcC